MAENDNSNDIKSSLAKRITTLVLGGTITFGLLGIAMAIVALCSGGVDDAEKILQLMFSSLLPLLGTWIGTILAFYFSRENLLAANQTVGMLVDKITSDKKLQSIMAKDVMISIDKLKYIEYKSETNDGEINLKTQFLNYLDENNISRIILLDENRVAKYVLHRSIIEGFISEQIFKNADKGPMDNDSINSLISFKNMKENGNEKTKKILLGGIRFIKENGSLADAKLLMKNAPECNDVFITKSGLNTEPVLGWITDKTISENTVVE